MRRVEHVLTHASKVHPQMRQEFESAYAVWWRRSTTVREDSRQGRRRHDAPSLPRWTTHPHRMRRRGAALRARLAGGRRRGGVAGADIAARTRDAGLTANALFGSMCPGPWSLVPGSVFRPVVHRPRSTEDQRTKDQGRGYTEMKAALASAASRGGTSGLRPPCRPSMSRRWRCGNIDRGAANSSEPPFSHRKTSPV